MSVVICRAGHSASVDDDGSAADCPCIRDLRAENARLTARVAELEATLESAEATFDDEEAAHHATLAEVESLKAQLAEAQALHDDALRQVGFHVRAANGLEEALSIERTRHASTSEQLRVAQEAQRKAWRLGFSAALNGLTMDEAEHDLAALSASAPKAEPTFSKECCLKAAEQEAGLGVPSQDLPCPVCDDVTLMRVAEAVKAAMLAEVVATPPCPNHTRTCETDATTDDIHARLAAIDLAAIVKGAKS